MTDSRSKGARREREWANLLTEEGFPSRRTSQNKSAPDAPDVESEAPITFWEVKGDEQISWGDSDRGVYGIMDKAEQTCGGAPWALVVKKNYKPWIIVMDLDNLMRLLHGQGR